MGQRVTAPFVRGACLGEKLRLSLGGGGLTASHFWTGFPADCQALKPWFKWNSSEKLWLERASMARELLPPAAQWIRIDFPSNSFMRSTKPGALKFTFFAPAMCPSANSSWVRTSTTMRLDFFWRRVSASAGETLVAVILVFGRVDCSVLAGSAATPVGGRKASCASASSAAKGLTRARECWVFMAGIWRGIFRTMRRFGPTFVGGIHGPCLAR